MKKNKVISSGLVFLLVLSMGFLASCKKKDNPSESTETVEVTADTSVVRKLGIATPSATQPAEASGGELVGSLGAGHYLSPGFLGSFSVSYDNNNATLVRAALSYTFSLFH